MSLTSSTSPTCTAAHLTTHLVVMGVSGCGKTTLGEALATQLGWPFFDADDFHPPENVAKMRASEPLNDADRAPWLLRLSDLLQSNPHAVLACSALKERYRDVLKAKLPNLRFIHPHGAFEIIAARIEARSKETGHYMPASLLQSQFDTLERCEDALLVDIEMPRQERVAFVLNQLKF
jgi:gluconokinase